MRKWIKNPHPMKALNPFKGNFKLKTETLKLNCRIRSYITDQVKWILEICRPIRVAVPYEYSIMNMSRQGNKPTLINQHIC